MTLRRTSPSDFMDLSILSQSKFPPYQHQIEGVKAIISKPFFFLADEMGAGKTKQTIDAAQVLFHNGVIDRVIVMAPASVRDVWYDPELGELKKHLWDTTPALVQLFHSRTRSWIHVENAKNRMIWVISNYEFIRSTARLEQILPMATPRTLLVLDESSAVKSSGAKQTKACSRIRNKCGRVLLLNGTPIEHSPLDLFSQGSLMSPSILECRTIFHFKSRYARVGGYKNKQIIGWVNLEDLQRRFAPYVLRRLKVDCVDLPDKLPPVVLPVPLSAETWGLYKSMRDEMVAWLSDETVSTAQQAVVKIARLAQITSGILGGAQSLAEDDLDRVDEPLPDIPAWMLPFVDTTPNIPDLLPRKSYPELAPGVYEVGREKLDYILDWLELKLETNPSLKVLIWVRFKAELARLVEALRDKFPKADVAAICGGQKKVERTNALRLLDPRTAPAGSVIVVGTMGTGARGLNLTASHTVVFLSHDFKLGNRLQAEDRVHRPGQVHPVSYFDVVATGPAGQKTIDHKMLRVQRDKEDIAKWTTGAWIKMLKDE